MSGADAELGGALSAAREDRDSVVELTRQLVRVPSRAGIDPYEPVLECMSAWLDRHGLWPWQLWAAGGETVAMACEITGGRAGPRYVLDACPDTAPFGDEALNVDVRPTPTWDAAAAETLLHSLADEVDAAWPGTQRTLMEVTTRWPTYQLPDDSRLKTALLAAARQAGRRQRRRSPGHRTSATTWPVSASRQPPAGGPVSGVRGGPVPAGHAAGGGV